MDMILLCHIEAYAYAVVVLAEVTNGGESAIAAYRGKSLKERQNLLRLEEHADAVAVLLSIT